MRAREFLYELGPVVSATTTTSQVSGKDQEIGKLSSLVTNLQKQVQDLQKNALQTTTQMKTIQQPKPAPMGQPPQQAAAQGSQPAAATKTVSQSSTSTTGSTGPTITPGVNQNPQVTTMKIKQQLATNQGQSV